MESKNNSWSVSSQILSSLVRVSLFPIQSSHELMLKEAWTRPTSLITVDLRDRDGEKRGGRALSGLTLFDVDHPSLDIDVGLEEVGQGWSVDVSILIDRESSGIFVGDASCRALVKLRGRIDDVKNTAVSVRDYLGSFPNFEQSPLLDTSTSFTVLNTQSTQLPLNEQPHYKPDPEPVLEDELTDLISQAHILLSSSYPDSRLSQAYYLADLATIYAELAIARVGVLERGGEVGDIDGVFERIGEDMKSGILGTGVRMSPVGFSDDDMTLFISPANSFVMESAKEYTLEYVGNVTLESVNEELVLEKEVYEEWVWPEKKVRFDRLIFRNVRKRVTCFRGGLSLCYLSELLASRFLAV
jgi:hypothetical protein